MLGDKAVGRPYLALIWHRSDTSYDEQLLILCIVVATSN